MSHTEVYKQFTLYFPQIAEDVTTWFPNGQNSIRVRRTNGSDYAFTFHGNQDWKFETINSFIRDTKGAR